MNTKPILDLKDALSRMLDDTELLAEVFAVFEEETPVRLAIIEKGVAEGDFTLLKKYGHTLKGSSGTAGALRLRAAAFDFEQAVKCEDLSLCQSTFWTLKQIAQETLGEMRAYRRRQENKEM